LPGTFGKGDAGETDEMKSVAIAAAILGAILALLVLPAQAQMGGKRHRGDDAKSDQKKPQVDEKAYKSALERIPEPKEKYDPWGVARPADPVKQKQK
jgi:hypothetical protein